ncbi:MAG: hypothetical protein HQL12_04790 [Candidatus Omnitrophica bacterium]|nr:hypothetical protein [Candidatus Omnitrophota bacterium]
MAFHRRKTTCLEVSLDMPFIEKNKPAPPVNIVQQALVVRDYMAQNPDATPFSAAPKLNLHRKRIAKLLKIAENLPANLITELTNCNDPQTLRQMSINRLLNLSENRITQTV